MFVRLWLETIEDWEIVFNESKLPEPYKTYVEFDNYMSKLTWVKIENEDETVPQSGFYLFNCLGDNYTFYEFFEMEEKDKFCKYYLDRPFNGSGVDRPIEYHIVEDAEGEYLMKIGVGTITQ